MHHYAITLARPKDLPLLASIELAAARLLVGHAPEAVLAETRSQKDFERSLSEGHLWVALSNDVPVGFAQIKILEPTVAHLDEIDVRPDHGRRGVGTRLVMAVCAWATAAEFRSVTLSTFRDVQWNMPFYRKLGFEVIPRDKLSPALRAVSDDEARRGLDTARRVVMRRKCI